MAEFDGVQFGKEIVASVKAYLQRELKPLRERLAELEDEVGELPKLIDAAVLGSVDTVREVVADELTALPKPQDGKDADPALVAQLVTGTIERILEGWERPRDGIDGAPGKDGEPGRDADADRMDEMVRAEVARVLDGWQEPQDGKDGIDGKDGADGLPGKDGEPGSDGQPGRDGVDGKDGIDGKDGSNGIDGQPGRDGEHGQPGQDGINGKDGADGKDGSNGIDGQPGRDGEHGQPGQDGINGKDGADGRDGIGLAGAFQDKDGNLILTLGDGRTVNIGRVQGAPGIDGKDGRDGFGFDDMSEFLAEDGRTIIQRYQRGDEVKEFRHTFAVVLDRGIWKGGTYQAGDGVTWGGQYYIAQRPTEAKPHTPEANDDWRLAVKKGRDGKDGIVRTVNEKPIVTVVK